MLGSITLAAESGAASWSWWTWTLVSLLSFFVGIPILMCLGAIIDSIVRDILREHTASMLDALVANGDLDATLAADIAAGRVSYRRMRDLAIYAADGMAPEDVRLLLTIMTREDNPGSTATISKGAASVPPCALVPPNA